MGLSSIQPLVSCIAVEPSHHACMPLIIISSRNSPPQAVKHLKRTGSERPRFVLSRFLSPSSLNTAPNPAAAALSTVLESPALRFFESVVNAAMAPWVVPLPAGGGTWDKGGSARSFPLTRGTGPCSCCE